MQVIIRLLADGTLVLVLLISGLVVLQSIKGRFWRAVPIIAMAGLTSLLVGKVMSLLYQPQFERPFVELGLQPGAAFIDNPGFPSDHALLATVAVVAVYMTSRNRKLSIFLMSLVALMAVARVLALVHTPLDVIFGIVAGLSGGLWYKKLTK